MEFSFDINLNITSFAVIVIKYFVRYFKGVWKKSSSLGFANREKCLHYLEFLQSVTAPTPTSMHLYYAQNVDLCVVDFNIEIFFFKYQDIL